MVCVPPVWEIHRSYGAYIGRSIDVTSIIAASIRRAVRLHTETMRDDGLDKNGALPPRSLITQLKQMVAHREADRRAAGSAATPK
jgi:hypothetical protein